MKCEAIKDKVGYGNLTRDTLHKRRIEVFYLKINKTFSLDIGTKKFEISYVCKDHLLAPVKISCVHLLKLKKKKKQATPHFHPIILKELAVHPQSV